MSNASNQRKKLSLKGVSSIKLEIFPAKKFPDQKKEEAINKIIAKNKFFDIYLSTNVISEDVSNLFPPLFCISL